MDNVTFIEVPNLDGTITEHALIAHADESFTSMTKEHYEKLQAEQSTPSVIDEAEAK
jgi:hypothetical protein